MNYKMKIKILMLFIMWCVARQLGYTQTANLVAHYPMDAKTMNPTVSYAKFTWVRPYDVSGNGWHGQIVNETAFTEGTFLNNLPCLEKTGNSDAYLQIPDPFLSLSGGQFTMTCWVYWTQEEVNNNDVDDIISIPGFTVQKDTDKIRLKYKDASGNTSGSYVFFAGEGWYFVAVSINQSTQTKHTYRFNGTYNNQSSAMTSTGATAISGAFQTLQSKSQLLDANFEGKVRDIRFYNAALTKEQINTVRNTDWAWSQQTTFDNDAYINKGVFSFYPLDGTSFNAYKTEQKRGRNGITSSGTIAATTNRFGTSNTAIQFSGSNANMTTPKFVEDFSHGLTISFWTKIEDANLDSPTQGIAYPFKDTDTKYKIFFADDASNTTLLGMQQINDRLGLLRYMLKDNPNENIPWYAWFYDPVSFRKKSGWYHVVLSYDAYFMKVYMWKPGDNTTYSAYTYQGLRNQSKAFSATAWGIGNRTGNAIKYLDDFRIYNYPLSQKEAEALHKLELANNPINVNLKIAEEASETLPIIKAMLYPNPTQGNITVRLPENTGNGRVSYQITDISGKTVLSFEQSVQVGQEELSINQLDKKGLKAGMYILKVYSAGKVYDYKFIME
jgi:hypothetical protein